MNILVTNDDGLHTPGIWAMVKALKEVGTVTVIAPDREQSGVGAGVTLMHPVRVSEAVPRIKGVRTLAAEGTPADCVVLAMQGLAPQPIDLVVSGINEGANIGMYVTMSGTVGAAVHAHLWNVPAIAVSVSSLKDCVFQPAAKIAGVLAKMFQDGTLSGPMLLNVNLPNQPQKNIEGVMVTSLARGKFSEKLMKADMPKHDYYFIARGDTEWEEEEGTDVWAIRRKRISITPLHMELTSDVIAPMLAEFAPTIFQEFQKGQRK
ncbi:MAG: 5'/3'-nucleotidase SurE [Chloroflexi bacterium]|nr:5'/3'-nucleotidase SurE [Chloroflexota bacterium]